MPKPPKDTSPTAVERRQFGEDAESVAYLRRGCHLTVAPFDGGYRIGERAAVVVVDSEGLHARALPLSAQIKALDLDEGDLGETGIPQDPRGQPEGRMSTRQEVIALARTHPAPEELLQHIDRGVKAEIVRELLLLGCERAIEEARESDRPSRQPETRRGRSQPAAAGYSPPRSTGAAMAARLRSLMPAYDWSLPNGAQLGQASVADLDNAIAVHTVKTQANIAWVKFYGAVKARLLRAKAHTVSDALSAPQLESLRKESGVPDDES